MSAGPKPPRWLEGLLERVLPRGLSGQATLGDLEEEYGRRARRSPTSARLWYAGQALSLVAYRLAGADRIATSGDSDLLLDLRWSARSMVRHPGFTAAVVVVLGLGLGANAGVFSVLDGTLANTSWWAQPDRAVAVWPGEGFSYGQVELFRDGPSPFRTLGGYQEQAFALRRPDGTSLSANGVTITPELFGELAVQPRLGRALAPGDGVLGAEPVAIIGEALWRESFGADPEVLGERVILAGARRTIVGVQGAGGRAPGGRAQVWVPLVMDPRDDDYWRAQGLTVVGILDEGRTLADAGEALRAFNERLTTLFPAFYPPGYGEGDATVEPADQAQQRAVSTPLFLLLGGTGLLLLVTALNVGNLLVGRTMERRREMAVRRALGASRGRLVRQLAVEGTVLTALALGVGLVVGSLSSEWIARLFVGTSVVGRSPILSGSVLLFSLGAAAAAWVILNGTPVLHLLSSPSRGIEVAPSSGAGVRRVLVTVQAALATLLLVSATLLVSTVDNLRSVPLGFEAEGMVAVELSPPEYLVTSPGEARDLYDRLVEAASAVAGVEAAGLTAWLPLRERAAETPVNLRTAPVEPAQALRVPMHAVDPGFFVAAGVEPRAGRLIGTEERADAPTGVVVNETLAGMLWPGGDPVGQEIAIDPHAWDRWVPVVGVVPDLRSSSIGEAPGPALYVALAEQPSSGLTLVVRSARDAGALATPLREAVRSVDPFVPVRSVTGMPEVVRAAYATSWVMMGLLTALALAATALGCLGIHAVLTQHVASRRREIGVRLALGAEPADVVGRVVRSGLLLALAGIVLGSGAAAVGARLLEPLLYGVSTTAPMAYLAPALALSLAAALAAWLPAARAGRLPPADVLRSE